MIFKFWRCRIFTVYIQKCKKKLGKFQNSKTPFCRPPWALSYAVSFILITLKLRDNEAKICKIYDVTEGTFYWDYSVYSNSGIDGTCVLLRAMYSYSGMNGMLFRSFCSWWQNGRNSILAGKSRIRAGLFWSRQLFCFRNSARSVLLGTKFCIHGNNLRESMCCFATNILTYCMQLFYIFVLSIKIKTHKAF